MQNFPLSSSIVFIFYKEAENKVHSIKETYSQQLSMQEFLTPFP